MKIYWSTIGVLCLTLFAIGCTNSGMTKSGQASQNVAPAATNSMQADYETALATAKAEINKAAAVGGEWRDTGALVKKAEAAAASGDYATAKKMADRARFEADMGQKQAAEQIDVGNPGYLRGY